MSSGLCALRAATGHARGPFQLGPGQPRRRGFSQCVALWSFMSKEASAGRNVAFSCSGWVRGAVRCSVPRGVWTLAVRPIRARYTVLFEARKRASVSGLSGLSQAHTSYLR